MPIHFLLSRDRAYFSIQNRIVLAIVIDILEHRPKLALKKIRKQFADKNIHYEDLHLLDSDRITRQYELIDKEGRVLALNECSAATCPCYLVSKPRNTEIISKKTAALLKKIKITGQPGD